MNTDIFDFVAYMHRDATWYDTPGYITVDDAAYDLRMHQEQGLELPDGITPELYADLWNEFSDEQQHGAAHREKAKQMENALRHVRQVLQIVHPDKQLDVVYSRETVSSVDSFTTWQRDYFGILPGEEYITVWNETGALLYVVNVTADSVLTAISELMDLLSRKF